jgi:subtilisin-like proprotein convertase family protein
MKRLRADPAVVHHVYRDAQAPASEYLITETFFVKFREDTPDNRIQEYLTAEHLVVEQDMGNRTYLVRVTDATGLSATPTVAGVCGLVLSANQSLTGKAVKQLVQQTATKDMSLFTDTPVNEPGDFDANGFSLWFGHGKVNALQAVKAAAGAVDPGTLVDVVQSPNVIIPDTGAVVSSTINIQQSGTIAELRVSVDIAHTFVSDLRVDLVAPDGTAVVLHNHAGGSSDNIVRTYSPVDTPALKPLLGRSIRGIWKLQVRDTVALDSGRLNRWRIAARVVGVPAAAAPTPNRVSGAAVAVSKSRARTVPR